jgi:hypothetical protein
VKAKAAASKPKARTAKKRAGSGKPFTAGSMRATSARTAARKPAGPSFAAETPRQEAAKYLARAAKETSRAARDAARAAREDARAKAQQERAEAALRRAEFYNPRSVRGERYAAEAATDLRRALSDKARAKVERQREAKAKAKAAADRAKAHDALVGAPAAGAVAGGWILGRNDDLDSCAAAAVANSLLACTGLRVADRDVLDLYLAVTRGRDCGASMADTLAAAALLGIGGYRPSAVLYLAAVPAPVADGLIITLPGHAAVLAGGLEVSWGLAREAGASGDAGGCWQVSWRVP